MGTGAGAAAGGIAAAEGIGAGLGSTAVDVAGAGALTAADLAGSGGSLLSTGADLSLASGTASVDAASADGILGTGVSGSDVLSGLGDAAKLGALGYAGYNMVSGGESVPAVSVGTAPTLAPVSVGSVPDITNYETTPTGGKSLADITSILDTSVTGLQTTAQNTGALGATLQASALGGPLPTGVQGGINAATAAETSALQGTFNRLGLGNSTMAAQGQESIQGRAATLADTYRTTMLDEAMKALGMSATEYSAMATTEGIQGQIQNAIEAMAIDQAKLQVSLEEAQAQMQVSLEEAQAQMQVSLQEAQAQDAIQQQSNLLKEQQQQQQAVQQAASSGGGTVICTHLYYTGELDPWEARAMQLWGNGFVDQRYWQGYRAWAVPYVRSMKHSPRAVAVARHVVWHIARATLRGRAYGAVLSGLSWGLGALIGSKRGTARHGC